MKNKRLSPEMAEKVYDILVDVCGASETMRNSFVTQQTTELVSEWRFCGTLGFGGKFWNCNDKLYVNCYREDETPKIRETIEQANEQLSKLGTSKILLSLPPDAAKRLINGWRTQDPLLLEMIKEFGIEGIFEHEED
jgi:hypothetical protein